MQFKNTYINHINGLRAIAVLAVLVFHIDEQFFKSGFLGVDVFFVISGYLITRSICRSIELGKFSFKDFYYRRMKRLFPAFFVTLLVTTVIATCILGPEAYLVFLKTLGYASFQFSNFFFARSVGYFDVGNTNQLLLHTWSLSVEEQFYIFWPLIIVFITKIFKRNYRALALSFLFLFLGSFVLGSAISLFDSNKAYYMFYTRGWEFCIGALCVFIEAKLKKEKFINNTFVSFSSLVLLCLSCIFLNPEIAFYKLYLLPCLLTAILIITDKTWTHKILGSKPMMYIGDRSYSIYLWHWPIICVYKAIYADSLSWQSIIQILGITFFLAHMSYKYIEEPIRKYRPTQFKSGLLLKSYKSKYLFGCVMLMASLVIVAVSLKPMAGNYGRLELFFDKKAIAESLKIDTPDSNYQKIVNINFTPYGKKAEKDFKEKDATCSYDGAKVVKGLDLEPLLDCLKYNLGPKDGILVIGDSHGRDFFHALKTKYPGQKIAMLHQSSCIPYKTRKHKTCFPKFPEIFNKHLLSLNPKAIFLSSRYRKDDIEYVKKSYEFLRDLFGNVFLVGASPEFKSSVADVILANYKSISSDPNYDVCTHLKDDAFGINNELEAFIKKTAGAEYFVDKMKILSNSKRCYLYVPKSNISLYMDSSHLSIEGIKYLAEELQINYK